MRSYFNGSQIKSRRNYLRSVLIKGKINRNTNTTIISFCCYAGTSIVSKIYPTIRTSMGYCYIQRTVTFYIEIITSQII